MGQCVAKQYGKNYRKKSGSSKRCSIQTNNKYRKSYEALSQQQQHSILKKTQNTENNPNSGHNLQKFSTTPFTDYQSSHNNQQGNTNYINVKTGNSSVANQNTPLGKEKYQRRESRVRHHRNSLILSKGNIQTDNDHLVSDNLCKVQYNDEDTQSLMKRKFSKQYQKQISKGSLKSRSSLFKNEEMHFGSMNIDIKNLENSVEQIKEEISQSNLQEGLTKRQQNQIKISKFHKNDISEMGTDTFNLVKFYFSKNLKFNLNNNFAQIQDLTFQLLKYSQTSTIMNNEQLMQQELITVTNLFEKTSIQQEKNFINDYGVLMILREQLKKSGINLLLESEQNLEYERSRLNFQLVQQQNNSTNEVENHKNEKHIAIGDKNQITNNIVDIQVNKDVNYCICNECSKNQFDIFSNKQLHLLASTECLKQLELVFKQTNEPWFNYGHIVSNFQNSYDIFTSKIYQCIIQVLQDEQQQNKNIAQQEGQGLNFQQIKFQKQQNSQQKQGHNPNAEDLDVKEDHFFGDDEYESSEIESGESKQKMRENQTNNQLYPDNTNEFQSLKLILSKKNFIFLRIQQNPLKKLLYVHLYINGIQESQLKQIQNCLQVNLRNKMKNFQSASTLSFFDICKINNDPFDPWTSRQFKAQDISDENKNILGGFPFYKPYGWNLYSFKNCNDAQKTKNCQYTGFDFNNSSSSASKQQQACEQNKGVKEEDMCYAFCELSFNENHLYQDLEDVSLSIKKSFSNKFFMPLKQTPSYNIIVEKINDEVEGMNEEFQRQNDPNHENNNLNIVQNQLLQKKKVFQVDNYNSSISSSFCSIHSLRNQNDQNEMILSEDSLIVQTKKEKKPSNQIPYFQSYTKQQQSQFYNKDQCSNNNNHLLSDNNLARQSGFFAQQNNISNSNNSNINNQGEQSPLIGMALSNQQFYQKKNSQIQQFLEKNQKKIKSKNFIEDENNKDYVIFQEVDEVLQTNQNGTINNTNKKQQVDINQTVGKGIILYQKIENMNMQNPVEITYQGVKQQFQIKLLVKVKSESIKIPKGYEDKMYVVNSPSDIHPFGLVLKSVTKNNFKHKKLI